MNPITVFVAIAFLVVGAALVATGYLVPGVISVVVAIVIAAVAATQGPMYLTLACIGLVFAGLAMFQTFTLGDSRGSGASARGVRARLHRGPIGP